MVTVVTSSNRSSKPIAVLSCYLTFDRTPADGDLNGNFDPNHRVVESSESKSSINWQYFYLHWN